MAFLEADTQQGACRFRFRCEQMSRQRIGGFSRESGTTARRAVSHRRHTACRTTDTPTMTAFANVDVRAPFPSNKDGQSARYNFNL
jgi:hypothetical protein